MRVRSVATASSARWSRSAASCAVVSVSSTVKLRCARQTRPIAHTTSPIGRRRRRRRSYAGARRDDARADGPGGHPDHRFSARLPGSDSKKRDGECVQAGDGRAVECGQPATQRDGDGADHGEEQQRIAAAPAAATAITATAAALRIQGPRRAVLVAASPPLRPANRRRSTIRRATSASAAATSLLRRPSALAGPAHRLDR